MRAAVLTAAGVMTVVDDREEPVAGIGEVIVEVDTVGLCGTDLGYWTGARSLWADAIVLGHEAVGRIVAIGPGVDPARIGAVVAVEPNYPCGRCAACLRAHPALCTDRRSPVIREDGFLAERVAVPDAFAWTVPVGVAAPDAAAIEPLAVVLAALRRAGEIDPAQSVLVVGAGSIGRIAVDVLVRRGLRPAVVDRLPDRVARAVALGARTDDAGERVDLVIETTGSGAAATAAVDRLAPAGRMVVVGLGAEPLALDTRVLVRRGLTIIGSMTYDHPVDFAAAVAAVAEGRARPGAVLGDEYPLDRAADAFTAAATAADKVVIRCSPSTT